MIAAWPPPPALDALPDEPTWVDGSPAWWWLTKRYLRMSPRQSGGRRFSSAKHAVTPEHEED